jgi:Fe-S-cluster containining protein
MKAPELAEGAAPWYQAGLKFTCTQCGNCCTGAAGFTWVSESEIAILAQRLGLDQAAFRGRYTQTVWRQGEQRVTLIEKRGGDCVFFQRGSGCSVYSDRPRQCRTWPFWKRVVSSRDHWDEEAAGCPGMDHGTLHAAADIAASAADDGL